MSYLLIDSFEEKIALIKKLSDAFIKGTITGSEIHYLLELIITDDILKSKIPQEYKTFIEEMHSKLAFYQPEYSGSKDKGENYFGDNELKLYLKKHF